MNPCSWRTEFKSQLEAARKSAQTRAQQWRTVREQGQGARVRRMMRRATLRRKNGSSRSRWGNRTAERRRRQWDRPRGMGAAAWTTVQRAQTLPPPPQLCSARTDNLWRMVRWMALVFILVRGHPGPPHVAVFGILLAGCGLRFCLSLCHDGRTTPSPLAAIHCLFLLITAAFLSPSPGAPRCPPLRVASSILLPRSSDSSPSCCSRGSRFILQTATRV